MFKNKFNNFKNKKIELAIEDIDRSLEIDLKTTELVLSGYEKSRIILSESGINTSDDIQYLKKCGADAFLIGSSIMKSDNIVEQVKKLVNSY